MGTGDEKKWYDQTFWIIFFLVVLARGLVLMWRGACTWHVAVKIVVTIVLVGVVALSYQMSQAVMAAQGDDGDIAGRPGVGTGLSPVLKQWLARLHRPLGCSVRCATCARGQSRTHALPNYFPR